jgi:hypothetical protein
VSAQPRRAAGRVTKKSKQKPRPEKKPVKDAETPAAKPESGPNPLGRAPQPAGARGNPEVLDVKEQGDAGVKTYRFGAVEVEGRLKSPQIVYFLRRVRAEFAAGALGHRSFMGELSDTRNNAALK